MSSSLSSDSLSLTSWNTPLFPEEMDHQEQDNKKPDQQAGQQQQQNEPQKDKKMIGKIKMNKLMPTNVGKQGLDLIRHFEGFQPQIYTCPGGKPTIGYGHVVREDESFNQPIGIQKGYDLLKKDLIIVENALHELVKVPLATYQFDALASFIYNVGVGAFGKSTLLKRLNEGEDPYDASAEFLKWVFAGKKRLRGLMRRREAERGLFIKGAI